MNNYKQGFYKFFMTVLIAMLFSFMTQSVYAAGEPIPGIDIYVEQDPGGIISKGTSNKKGQLRFKKLKSGRYFLRINKSSLQAKGYNSHHAKINVKVSPNGNVIHQVSIELKTSKIRLQRHGIIPVNIKAKQGGTVIVQVVTG